jgi:hypothetical protein
LRQALVAGEDFGPDPSRQAIGPASLDKHPSGSRVSGLGDAAARRLCAGRSLAGRQAEIGHDLTRIGKTMEVADLGHQGDGGDERDAAQGLNSADDKGERPRRRKLPHSFGQAIPARLGLFHRLHEFIEGNLACWMV